MSETYEYLWSQNNFVIKQKESTEIMICISYQKAYSKRTSR